MEYGYFTGTSFNDVHPPRLMGRAAPTGAPPKGLAVRRGIGAEPAQRAEPQSEPEPGGRDAKRPERSIGRGTSPAARGIRRGAERARQPSGGATKERSREGGRSEATAEPRRGQSPVRANAKALAVRRDDFRRNRNDLNLFLSLLGFQIILPGGLMAEKQPCSKGRVA